MRATFYYRCPDKFNRSIERVFEAVSSGLAKGYGIEIRNVYARSSRLWLVAMLCNIIRLGLLSHKSGINHITGDIHYTALLMPRSRTVLTVHDLVSLHSKDINPAFKRFVYYLWYYLPLKHLKYVTCISESTKRDLVSFFPFAEAKITVIPNPLADGFTAMEALKNHKPVILHVGTRANKNLERVIMALASLNCHLRIIGKLTQEQLKLLDDTKVDYSNAFGLSDDDMIKEYRKCDIVSFPSLYEGFGMPVIEGQACGRIVVTSDLNPMKSISGGAAVLVNPEDVDSIRQGFESILNNGALRLSLVDKGLKNAAEYSITAVSTKYKELYDRML